MREGLVVASWGLYLPIAWKRQRVSIDRVVSGFGRLTCEVTYCLLAMPGATIRTGLTGIAHHRL